MQIWHSGLYFKLCQYLFFPPKTECIVIKSQIWIHPSGMDTFLSPFAFIFPLETCPFRRVESILAHTKPWHFLIRLGQTRVWAGRCSGGSAQFHFKLYTAAVAFLQKHKPFDFYCLWLWLCVYWCYCIHQQYRHQSTQFECQWPNFQVQILSEIPHRKLCWL